MKPKVTTTPVQRPNVTIEIDAETADDLSALLYRAVWVEKKTVRLMALGSELRNKGIFGDLKFSTYAKTK